MCLASGNPKIEIEIQVPIHPVISSQHDITHNELRNFDFIYHNYEILLKGEELNRFNRALWWYRKGCNSFRYSVFDSYTAYWNSLEIICNVSGNKTKKGDDIDEIINKYIQAKLNKKKKLKAGDIAHLYNQHINYSIKDQMEDTLKKLLGEKEGEEWAFYCFKVKPDKDRFYQIRNDINHGNIQENSSEDVERVFMRGMLLQTLIYNVLHKVIKITIPSTQKDVKSLVDKVMSMRPV